jgi:hypothetical protein
MKTLFAIALLATTIAFANPRLTFDDSGFDYRPTDDETIAYVDLTRDGDALRLTFSNQPGSEALPTVSVAEIVDLDHEDVLGNDVLATVAELDEVAVLYRGTSVGVITIDHAAADLGQTVQSYLTVLERLGFATQCESETATLKVYTFGDGAAAFRAVFHQQDGSVQVRITL